MNASPLSPGLPGLPPGANRRAFTLIELLTVIAIIGILAAIIIPTVGAVRAKARSTQCVSNLRQIGMAMNLYADENKNRFPATYQTGDSSAPDYNTTWMMKLAPYVGIQGGVLGPAPAYRATGVFDCPDFISSATAGDPNYRKVAYSYNDSITPTAEFSTYWNFRRNVVPAPSQVFLLIEIADNKDAAKPVDLRYRHSGNSANFLFADGHVATVPGPVLATDARWRWSL